MTSKLFNQEAEQAVLGAILVEGSLIHECTLLPVHFSPGSHQLIFQAMRGVEESRQEVDIVSVTTKLGDLLGQVGGLNYLCDLADAVPTTANFTFYEQYILEAFKLWETRKIASNLVDNPERFADYYQDLTRIQEITQKETRTSKDILVEIYDDIGREMDGLSGVDTGIADLNRMTGGLQNGDLAIIAARPSVGKTAFSLHLAMSHCKTGGFTTFFSLEMQDKQIVKRMLSAIGSVNGAKWQNPFQFFTGEDHIRISRAAGVYDQWNLDIRDQPDVTVYDIRAAVHKNIRQHPEKKHLVIIDYLQLIRFVGKFDRHDLAIGQISKALKNLARECNIPVVLLSQLSRGVEQRHEKRPMMSDIRDSGNVEQDADIVCLLYRDDYYNKDNDDNKNIIEAIIAKHRNGPVSTVKMAFLKEYGKFMNWDRGSGTLV
ncbi:replicative DNA helicase [Schinkia azotoformans]|uniref:replicative DNA helicase n=1 Tax=Schinkia azotoformans TaxID=1454 RepID=UPI002E21DA62|nr:replicative DNA helicase [Schinkia azotoformans]